MGRPRRERRRARRREDAVGLPRDGRAAPGQRRELYPEPACDRVHGEVHRTERRTRPHDRDEPLESRACGQRIRRRRAGRPHPAGDDQHPRGHGRRPTDAACGNHARLASDESTAGTEQCHRDRCRRGLDHGLVVARSKCHRLQRLPRIRPERRRTAARRAREPAAGDRNDVHRLRALVGDHVLLRRHRGRRRRPVARVDRGHGHHGGGRRTADQDQRRRTRLHVVHRRHVPSGRVLHGRHREHVDPRDHRDKRLRSVPERTVGTVQLRDSGRKRRLRRPLPLR